MQLNAIEDIIADMRQGKMVILMDDEDRENEGDLVLAAELVRPEDINFMARYGRGLICLTLTQERCQQLHLPFMVQNNQASYSTNFTVSIEAATGVTTGISAADRATTIKAAMAPDAKPGDLVQPGHVFPIVAQPGGVLSRAGHTEAGCDLARLAGLAPASVIVEIMNEDGSMARRPDLETFAQLHNLKIGTIADLIHYRTINEKTVHRVASSVVETEFGPFQLSAYRDEISGKQHLAMVRGEITESEPCLVRVHIEDPLVDLCGVRRSEGTWPLRAALAKIAEHGCGVVVILARHLDDDALLARIQPPRESERIPVRNEGNDVRVIGTGAQILADLNVHRMHLLSSPKRFHALSGFELSVEDYIPYIPE